METYNYYIEEDYVGVRLDVFLSEQFDDYSRSFIQGLIKDDLVSVNGSNKVKKNYKLSLNDDIQIDVPEPKMLEAVPEEMDLDIVYEDDQVMVINKPKGMVVHPAPGNYTGTLVNGIMFYSERLSDINGVIRPGIVHRIDKDTSGLLMIAKTNVAHQHLSDLLKDHDITRKYVAIVHGNFTEDFGTIDRPIARSPKNRLKMAIVSGGRRAVTHYNVLERYGQYSLIECVLETGRTHQIRVHMASAGHPLVGDPLYGVKKESIKHDGQMLHAKTLGFVHPTLDEYMEFTSELPEHFTSILEKIRSRFEIIG